MDFLELVNQRLDWLQDHRGERHYKDTLYIARKWVTKWGDLTVAEITPTIIEDHLRQVKNQVSVPTANKNLRHLRSLFNHGIKPPRKWFKENPTDGIEFYKLEEVKERYVPPVDDVLKVMLAASPDQEDYLWTLALTMGRKGEVDRLEWKDVDFDRNTVTLYTRKSRGGNRVGRKIPMVPKLKEILRKRYEARHETKSWIFWHHYWSRTEKAFVEGPYKDRKKMMHGLCKKAGVKYFRFHPLLHFGATMLERVGVPIITIQTLLGHQNRSTTEIYLHSVGDEERSAMDQLETLFEKSQQKPQQISGVVAYL
jgi:integrase